MWQQEDWTFQMFNMLFITRQVSFFFFNFFLLLLNSNNTAYCLIALKKTTQLQVPRTSETYVHRSGRTARATKEGLSLLLVGPDDMMNFRKICKTLGKTEELPMFPIETKCLEAIKVMTGANVKCN